MENKEQKSNIDQPAVRCSGLSLMFKKWGCLHDMKVVKERKELLYDYYLLVCSKCGKATTKKLG